MHKLPAYLLCISLLLAAQTPAGALSLPQDDTLSAGVKAVLDSMITGYAREMTFEAIEVKEGECDFMISTTPVESWRAHVARTLFNYYKESMVMGEEEVAIYIYDKWFSNGQLKMEGEFDAVDAQLFVEFNRNTQIGMEAPEVTMRDTLGNAVRLPQKGVVSVLFFYDISCAKCNAICRMLPSVMKDVDTEINFYAAYVGAEEYRWKGFISTNFNFNNEKIKVINTILDEDLDYDVLRLWGIISTPRLYLTDPNAIIFGRRLEMDSLTELLHYASVLNDVYRQSATPSTAARQ